MEDHPGSCEFQALRFIGEELPSWRISVVCLHELIMAVGQTVMPSLEVCLGNDLFRKGEALESGPAESRHPVQHNVRSVIFWPGKCQPDDVESFCHSYVDYHGQGKRQGWPGCQAPQVWPQYCIIIVTRQGIHVALTLSA